MFGVEMIEHVDVIFFVEHKDRELDSIKDIANELKKKNISSVILSVYYHIKPSCLCFLILSVETIGQ